MKRLLLGLALGATLCAAAYAQSRYVFVNGQRLTEAQIAHFDRVQCTRIPSGRYWLNTATGAWGYAGNARVQGYLGDLCRGRSRHKSLSERGLLYTPGDLNFR